MYCVDPFRYGRFEYRTADEIPLDGYIELPITATNIVIHRQAPGHQARFEISTEDLRAWVIKMRSLCPELNQNANDEIWEKGDSKQIAKSFDDLERQIFDRFFAKTGGTFEPKMTFNHVTRSSRGGGYTIWHAPVSNLAYLNAGYW